MTYRRDWKACGKKYNGTPAKQKKFASSVEKMPWVKTPEESEPALSIPAMQGCALNDLISEFRMPNVSAVSWQGPMLFGRYVLLGVEARYKNGRVRLYAAHEGHVTVPVAVDFWRLCEACGAEVDVEHACAAQSQEVA